MNSSTTPLISLKAVALDTETTGLDARIARIVEIAAVRLTGAEVHETAALDVLVNPGTAIPKNASEIHGLTAADVAAAPRFGAIAPHLSELFAHATVVGHNIGYDLAVLDREFARAGLSWTMPRFLDVRALAKLVAPNLASYSLDALCDWLGVGIDRRHRALPDAMAAARVFAGLIPLLRARGIWTLAEAQQALNRLPGESRLHEAGGWVRAAHAPAADPVPVLARLDGYLYRHRVRDLPLPQPVFVDPCVDLKDVARRLTRENAAGIAIAGTACAPRGLITAADLLAAAIEAAPGTAAGPWTGRAQGLATIGEDEFLYRALGRLQHLGVKHLGVVNRRGEVIATLSAAELLSHRASSALVLGDEIESARSVADLGRAWAGVTQVAQSCLSEGIGPPDVAGIISAEMRALTARAAGMAEARLRETDKGGPPCAYAVLVLGSGGRGDSLLSADQDNAIVYASGKPGGPEDAWFADAGRHIADILNEVGIRYCPGGVMAMNPGCRHSLDDWKEVVNDWVGRAQVEDLLAADIFFDGVPVYGDIALADDLFDFAFARAEQSPGFIAGLAAYAKSWYPPIGLLGNLALDSDGRLDLKRNGLLPIVTAARTLALKHAIRPTATLARLQEVKERELADGGVIDRAKGAFVLIQGEVLKQQIADAHHGIPLSARVQASALPGQRKREIKAAMQAINALIGVTLNL